MNQQDFRPGLLADIRTAMKEANLDALIVPFSDPHQSEYIPGHWKFREWVSGFTGSAGVIVISANFAGLWTDSRYFHQAEEQISGSGIELVKLTIPHTPEYIDWLKSSLPKGSTVGLDKRYFPVSMIRFYEASLEQEGMKLTTGADLLTKLWTSRPDLPCNPIFEHKLIFAGVSRKQKINAVRERLIEVDAQYQFISPLDEVAWLFNLRGSDVAYCPVFVSYSVIGLKEALLFTHLDSIPEELKRTLLDDGIFLMDYSELLNWIGTLTPGQTVCLAPEKTSGAILEAWSAKCVVLEGMNSTTALKAIKNSVEADGLRRVMVRDGIAWVKALCTIYAALDAGEDVTEISVAQSIAHFRAEQENYIGESFHPISSYGYHGAIVHYSVSEESSIPLKKEGIFLLDTGGQFLDGTTDTTRTIALGKPNSGQKIDFTLALKGTLAVSSLSFPAGTRGYQIDVLARMGLWNHGKNYGHGTGHGVGFFLNVHEGPQTIGTSASGYPAVTLESGMVTTVEPAIYKDGEYGMRTENMTLIVPDSVTAYGTFFKFETLTLVPIDINLIETGLLTPMEIDWLNQYHERVRKVLSPLLEKDFRHWLHDATNPIIV